MALDSAAWFLSQPGATHSSEVARSFAYMATGGKQGIAQVGDLKVTAQSTPTGSVRVAPGVAAIQSKYAGASGQMYVGRNISTTNVTIQPTTSSGIRTDLVVLRIQDTAFEGSAPSDPTNYNYVRLEVIQGVNNAILSTDELNLTYPAIALAKIRIPASTSAITSAMITDLRKVANPRQETVVINKALIGAEDTGYDLKLTGRQAYPDGEWWPNKGGPTNTGLFEVDVPSWATQMEIRAEWLSVRMAQRSGWGMVWVTYGPDAGSETPSYFTQGFGWDGAENANIYRTNFIAIDTKAVPASFRGKPMKFTLRGTRFDPAGGTQNGAVSMDSTSGIAVSFRFLEKADDNSA